MFEESDKPLPPRDVLRLLIHKVATRQPLELADYEWLSNILRTLEHDPSYKLRQRMKEREAESRQGSDPKVIP